MTKMAKEEYTGGSPRIRIGALNRGFMIMARGRDYETIADSNANYMAHYGRLVPEGVSEAELLNEAYDDPFKDVTYAVFKAKLKEAKVGPDSF